MTTKDKDLESTIAGLRSRRKEVTNELDTLRDGRGATALAAARTGDTKPLDELDRRISALERESGDIEAALGEAAHQQSEAKDRGMIEASKVAVRALPAATKKLQGEHRKLWAAIDNLLIAIADTRAAEQAATSIAHEAVPYVLGVDDPIGRGNFTFRHSHRINALIESALAKGGTVDLADAIASDVEAITKRIHANADIRQQRIERDLAEKRAGKQQKAA
ncbi:MAG: hypothetical protein NVV60_00560 [Luteimonas sp.]|nr:hypothetical protein [Luteimonas sp.]